MFIATCAVGCVKLRRSGMNGTGDHDKPDPDHAAPTELGSACGGPHDYKHGDPNGAEAYFGFRISGFLRISAFGFRI